MSIPKPVLSGQLGTRSLFEVFATIFRRKFTGTLAVWPNVIGVREDRILFRDGIAVSIKFRDTALTADAGLSRLFDGSSASYACYDVDLVQSIGCSFSSAGHPLALISDLLRAHFPSVGAARRIAKVADVPQRLQRRVSLSNFCFSAQEISFIDYIRAAPATAKELVEGYGDRALATRMVYLLLITGYLEQFASETKSLRRVASPLPTPAVHQPCPRKPVVTNGLSVLQNAKKCVDSRDWTAALEYIEVGLRSTEDKAAHLSLKAWVLLHKDGIEGKETLREIRSLLREAERKDPEHANTYYVAGILHRKRGKEQKAISCFKQAARIDPYHLQAAREVSLARIRSRDNTSRGWFKRRKS